MHDEGPTVPLFYYFPIIIVRIKTYRYSKLLMLQAMLQLFTIAFTQMHTGKRQKTKENDYHQSLH